MVIIKLKKIHIIDLMSKPADFKILLGDFVRRKRTEKGWSQSDLAAKIGNNYQNISRLERGETSPTLEWCYRLAAAFDMDMIDFIKEFNYKL
jgi:transcriptional regulator with XRE-family HTH domain